MTDNTIPYTSPYTSLALALAFLAALATACSSSDSRRGEVTFRTALVQYSTCSALEADLKDLLISEMEAHFEQNGQWGRGVPDLAVPAAGEVNDSDGGRQAGRDFSGTNNQEEGVDEADFVKTDGYHIYTINGNRLHIFAVPEFGQLVPEAVFTLEGQPRQMLVNKDAGKAVVFSQIYPYTLPEDHPIRALTGFQDNDTWFWRTSELSKLTVIDISDRETPALERELFIEGNYKTARMIDSSIRMGSYSWMNIPGVYNWWYYYDGNPLSREQAKKRARSRIEALGLGDMIPKIYERNADGSLATHSLSEDSCRSFYRPDNSHGRGFTSIMSLDLKQQVASGGVVSFDADHVVSNWSTLYASQDYLYVAEPANDWWWFWWNQDHPEQLNLHMFDIKTPGQTSYLGSGRVEGALHDEFSLDEHEGYLRVAATTNQWARWWVENPPESDNHIYVLDLDGENLVEVGHVSGIARGERIFSARMVGDKGYLVTFRQIDPLFTLDLSDPKNPRVVGELEIPGFSTYIHPIAGDKLLTIGVGGDENGANWRTQVSMFDVSDFAKPVLADREELVSEGNWGWSEALYEHKAFQYFAPKKLLALPLSGSRYDGNRWQYISTLRLISVDPETGLDSYGVIDHTHLFNTSDPERYWYYTDVRRSIFMGDFIYAISDRGITVHALDDVSVAVAQEELPGYTPADWYWWW